MITEVFGIAMKFMGGQAVVEQINKVDGKLREVSNSAELGGKKGSEGFTKLASSAAKALAPIFALKQVIGRTLDFAAQGEQLRFMAESAGIAAEQFGRLAMASERLGGTRAGMAGSLAGLSMGIQGLRRGEENHLTQAAMYYGVSLSGKNGLASPEEMIFNIARAMEGRSVAEQTAMGRMLGLDEGTIRLARQGVAGVRREMELAAKYNPFSPENLKDIERFQYSFREMKAALALLSGTLAIDLLPHFERWIEAGKDGLAYLTEHTDLLKVAAVGLGAALLAWLSPWLLGLGAAVLILDDIYTYLKGGESLTGRWIESLKEIPNLLDDAFTNFEENHPILDFLFRATNPLYGAAKGARGLARFAGDAQENGFFGALWNSLPTLPISVPNGLRTNNVDLNITINESGNPQKTYNAVGRALADSGVADSSQMQTAAAV